MCLNTYSRRSTLLPIHLPSSRFTKRQRRSKQKCKVIQDKSDEKKEAYSRLTRQNFSFEKQTFSLLLQTMCEMECTKFADSRKIQRTFESFKVKVSNVMFRAWFRSQLGRPITFPKNVQKLHFELCAGGIPGIEIACPGMSRSMNNYVLAFI